MERLMVGLPRDKVRVFLASTLVVAIAISVVGVVASIRQASEVSDVRARLAATGQELSKVKATLTDTQTRLAEITSYAPCRIEDMRVPVSRGFATPLIVRIRECAGGYARVDARVPARVVAPRGPVNCVRDPCAWQMWLKSDHHGEWRVFLMNEYPCPTRHVAEMSFPVKDFAKACEALGLKEEW
jgi:hypothetical protein